MESAQTYQQKLLNHVEAGHGKPVEERLRRAFLNCPRHLFIPQYLHPQTGQWLAVDFENPERHLPILYADRSLPIYQEESSEYVATISQPSLVLEMLSRLDIQPGSRVFEIGTGSGWNAALMSWLVGPEGNVTTTEILPELVASSQRALSRAGVQGVTVLSGDGALGYAPGAPFDRIVFTAGAYDIPLALHEQLREGGLALVVLKIPGGGDDLVLLRKQNGRLVSEYSASVQFVPMLGTYRAEWRDGVDLRAFLQENGLSPEPVSRVPFNWGHRVRGHFMPQTEGLRSFLHISEPGYRVFLRPDPGLPLSFGLFDEASRALVVASPEALISYGNPSAERKLVVAINQWVKRGMPSSVHLILTVTPKAAPVPAEVNGWILERTDSRFIWQLAGKFS